MNKFDKLIIKILLGTSDNNINFMDLRNMLEYLGFICRIKGGHFIYYKNGVDEIISIQPKGNKAKAYQIKQIRNIILKYKLGGDFIEQI